MTCSDTCNKKTRESLLKIGETAVEAMLYEAAATPKPGLVDRNNSGAHADMDFFTFMSSVSALRFIFDEMAEAGFNAALAALKDKKDNKPDIILPELRKIGLKAEKLMLNSTHGVNTHRGEIFSLGLLSGCAGWLIGENKYQGEDFNNKINKILDIIALVCKGLCDRDFANIENKLKNKIKLNHGESVYLKYGCTGIRGEAESGYLTVKNISLPVFKDLINKNFSVNDALVTTLINLIANTNDTNILARHDMQTLEYSRNYAAKVLDFINFEIKKHGALTPLAKRKIELMDEDFIKKNISPGGCSDLLAVTYFLFKLENKN